MRLYAYLLLLTALVSAGMLYADKYAGEIFLLSPGVANQAKGNTGLTDEQSVSAAWWNPALGYAEGGQGIEAAHYEMFNGLLQQNLLSGILGKTNPVSFSITHIGVDEIKLTELEHPDDPMSNDNRPLISDIVADNDIIAQIGISREVRPNLHIGLSPKLAYRSLGGESGFGFGADAGLLWKTHKWHTFGLNLRDVFTTQMFWENGTHELAAPVIDAESGFAFALFKSKVPVSLALRSQIYTEGRRETATARLGWFGADFNAGLAVTPTPRLTVYSGFDVSRFTAGATVRYRKAALDYGWVQGSDDALGFSQKVALSYRW